MTRRWETAPRAVRAAAVATVLVLAYGTVVHVVQLAVAGGDPYPDLPGWLRTYFVSLTVLDPLAALLLARRRRSGVVLAVAVLVSDAVANGWANHALDPADGLTAGRVGHGLVTLVAVGLLVATPGLWRATSPVYRRSAELAASPNDRHASSSATRSATSGGSEPATTSARVTRSSTRR